MSIKRIDGQRLIPAGFYRVGGACNNSGVDLFDVIAGSLGVASAIFGLWVYLDGKKKEAVERQKSQNVDQRLADIMSIANGIAKQSTLIVSLADRDDVTKKEMKHLVVAQIHGIEALQGAVRRTAAIERAWKFGQPATYLAPGSATVVQATGAAQPKAATQL